MLRQNQLVNDVIKDSWPRYVTKLLFLIIFRNTIFHIFIFLLFNLAGRPPFGQVPFLVLPEGKALAGSSTICKFVCALGGNEFPIDFF